MFFQHWLGCKEVAYKNLLWVVIFAYNNKSFLSKFWHFFQQLISKVRNVNNFCIVLSYLFLFSYAQNISNTFLRISLACCFRATRLSKYCKWSIICLDTIKWYFPLYIDRQYHYLYCLNRFKNWTYFHYFHHIL